MVSVLLRTSEKSQKRHLRMRKTKWEEPDYIIYLILSTTFIQKNGQNR